MQSRREAVAAIFWGAALYPLVAIAGLTGSIVVVRVLTPDSFGVLVWSLAAVQVVLVVSDFGTTLLLQRGDPPDGYLRRLLVIRIGVATLLGAAIPHLGSQPLTASVSPLLFPAVAVLQSISTLMQSRLMGAIEAVPLRLLGVMSSLTLPLAVLTVSIGDARADVGLLALLIASAAEALLGTAIVVLRSRRTDDYVARQGTGSVAAFYYLEKIGKTLGGGPGGMLLGGLGRTGGGVAVLGLGIEFASRVEALSFGAIGGLLLPIANKFSRDRGDGTHSPVFRETTRYLLGTFGAVMVFATTVLPTIVPALYGERYLESVRVAQVLLLGQAIAGSLGPAAINYTLIVNKVMPAMASRLCSVLLLAVALPLFDQGPLVVALAVAVASALPATGLHVFWAHRLRPPGHVSAIARIIVAVVAAGFAAAFAEWLLGGWLGAVSAFGLFSVVYVVALRLTGALTELDHDLVRQLPSPAAKLAEVVLLPGGPRR
jgi:O-antigen/teichoic acid export membrane protein